MITAMDVDDNVTQQGTLKLATASPIRKRILFQSRVDLENCSLAFSSDYAVLVAGLRLSLSLSLCLSVSLGFPAPQRALQRSTWRTWACTTTVALAFWREGSRRGSGPANLHIVVA